MTQSRNFLISDKIPEHKFNQFHSILCATGGRYKGKVVHTFDGFVKVEFSFNRADQYVDFNDRWARVNLNIVEVKRGIFVKFWRIIRNFLR